MKKFQLKVNPLSEREKKVISNVIVPHTQASIKQVRKKAEESKKLIYKIVR